MPQSKSDRSVTLQNLLIALVIIGILVAIAAPNYIKVHPHVPEAETKANCHGIQIAIERYFVDHGEYPPFLLGGDIEGWQAWHQKWDGINDIDMGDGRIITNEAVVDILIEQDYLNSYPNNAYVRDGQTMIQMTNLEGSTSYADGDPRFGYKGNSMGMVLDDPNFFSSFNRPENYGWSDVETRRTLDHGEWMNVPEAFIDPEYNQYYMGGGSPDYINHSPNGVRPEYIPGNFFYRATPELITSSEGFTLPYPNTNPGGKYMYYILGVYGEELDSGRKDVIRLVPYDSDGQPIKWRIPEEYGLGDVYCGYGFFNPEGNKHGGLPEVFGGGDQNTGPYWPYNQLPERNGVIEYGAPDGIPDGVILVLTNGSETERFRD
jgi:competence protein ComGC